MTELILVFGTLTLTLFTSVSFAFLANQKSSARKH